MSAGLRGNNLSVGSDKIRHMRVQKLKTPPDLSLEQFKSHSVFSVDSRKSPSIFSVFALN